MPSKHRSRHHTTPRRKNYIPFLEFPPFIRQRICRFLLCSSPNLEPMLSSDHPTKVFAHRIKTANDGASGWYDGTEDFTPAATLLAITLTCHAVSNESISVFYHDNLFVFSNFEILTKFLKGVGLKRRYMISNVSICMEGKAAAKAFALLAQSRHLHGLRLHFSLDSLKSCPKKDDDMDFKERVAFFPALKKLKESIKGLDKVMVTGIVSRALRRSLKEELMRPNPQAWSCKLRKLLPPRVDTVEEELEEEDVVMMEEAAAEGAEEEQKAGKPKVEPPLEALDWGDEKKPEELILREAVSRFVMTTVLGFGYWGEMWFDVARSYDYSSSEEDDDDAVKAPKGDTAEDAESSLVPATKPPKAKTSRKRATITQAQADGKAKAAPRTRAPRATKPKTPAAVKEGAAKKAPARAPRKKTIRGEKTSAAASKTQPKANSKPKTKPSQPKAGEEDDGEDDGEAEAEAKAKAEARAAKAAETKAKAAKTRAAKTEAKKAEAVARAEAQADAKAGAATNKQAKALAKANKAQAKAQADATAQAEAVAQAEAAAEAAAQLNALFKGDADLEDDRDASAQPEPDTDAAGVPPAPVSPLTTTTTATTT